MKNWLKLLFVILFFALISVSVYLILKMFNLTNINSLKQIILDCKPYSVLVYLLISVFVLVGLCFVPLLNTSLILLGIILFGSKTTFFVSLLSVFLSSTILFFIGDKFGESFAKKLVGEKDLEKAQNLVDYKSKFLLPIFFIFPAVPDEALCLVAGMTKMKYWYLILVSMLYHAIEFGIFCFAGSGIINWSNLSIIDWFILINVLIIDFILLLHLEKKFNKNK